ncbi:tpr repeat protein [Grosmannia clavigera kw1407]|uniref:Tpr repeat protein n=1 Tax=Grosmannia clavigera (strain kw1407 / UAMH 11150) TaxID=655863 RepID=F0XAE6_GROCL|nr:tpr repeat protein [Grosmannia clavigera kw1407]EFX05584.1 tpr repeat protein [Grosmannia clavigera kw1407]
MVQLQEITEDVAEKLRLGETSHARASEKTQSRSTAVPASAPASVAGPELPPAIAFAHSRTADEVLAELNKSPLFMTNLEDNDDIAALQALAYEGTPLENAEGFKERGNECFRESLWADAREFYDKGVALLVAEDRRRARGEAPAKRQRSEEEEEVEVEEASMDLRAGGDRKKEEEEEADPDSPEQLQVHRAVLEQLYANRAACQLSLRNFRACTLDCGAALRLNAANTKAWYRSGRALLALDKTDEAAEACRGGLAAAPDNTALQRLAVEVAARAQVVAERRRRDEEREANARRREARLRAALRARGIRTRTTEKPPEMEDAAVALTQPDDDGALSTDVSASTLVFPTVLLYPLRLQSDFVKAFGELDTLADHLAYVLPPPWDGVEGQAGAYGSAAAVDCFLETMAGGLVKVGKKMGLGRILGQAQVEVVDGLVRVFVVPRAESEEWVKDFKQKRAVEGEGMRRGEEREGRVGRRGRE